jgi:hypothetical protein
MNKKLPIAIIIYWSIIVIDVCFRGAWLFLIEKMQEFFMLVRNINARSVGRVARYLTSTIIAPTVPGAPG